MILEILIILLGYMAVMIVALYYYDLFQTKDTYSREEIKNFLPFFTVLLGRLSSQYALSMVFIVFFISAIIGLLLLILITHWFINSAILGLILYFITPHIKSRYEETQVAVTESYADSAIGIFIRYGYVIIIGFTSGMATALIYNWAEFKVIHFLWLLINLTVLSVITVLSLHRSIK